MTQTTTTPTDRELFDRLVAAVDRWQHENTGKASRALIELKDRIKRERAEQAGIPIERRRIG